MPVLGQVLSGKQMKFKRLTRQLFHYTISSDSVIANQPDHLISILKFHHSGYIPKSS
jgi:hypothetical protein